MKIHLLAAREYCEITNSHVLNVFLIALLVAAVAAAIGYAVGKADGQAR